MSTALRLRCLLMALVLCFLVGVRAFAQMETATLSGVINDPKGAVVPDVEVTATRIETGTSVTTKTNGAGIYFFTGLLPGHYHLMVRKPGFKEIAIKEFELFVQDKLEQNFSLEIGSVAETVTVTASTPLLNTQDATVSTVVDRQFAENLPMNGRSFQALIELTPGVVVTPSNASDSGQFSINGQRPSANYWTVDGVGANIGVGATSAGNGLGGAAGSFSALGGTNSLVSVDALQEFRVQTSTYAPEFGRTPGGQISIVTRSGSNQWHGTAFDYFRNDVLDANNWFNGAATPPLPKAKDRQNDFGGTFSGPILRDRSFFFFSYEGLRLRLPQTSLTSVPDVAARQNATGPMKPFLNAFPLPNGPDNVANGVAQFNASYSNIGSLDAYSLRIDHKLSDKVNLFGRYNYSPSSVTQRGFSNAVLSTPETSSITTQTGTFGVTWTALPTMTNDFRFNYSRTNGSSHFFMDNFGGAVPLSSLPFPSPFTIQNAQFTIGISSLGTFNDLGAGPSRRIVQRQINFVDSLSIQERSHSLKLGVDFRRLSPTFESASYVQQTFFSDVPSAENGNFSFGFIAAGLPANLLFRNLSLFAQDTWRIVPRLTLTYGIRWDVDFSPSSTSGPAPLAVTGFSLSNFSNLALAPSGAPPFNTRYGNVAPRVGVAYQLRQGNWQSVLRGGFGVFYDLATSEVGNSISHDYPFGASKFAFGGTFPLDAATAAPPPINPQELASLSGLLYAADPNLQLPYVLQWNATVEQALGGQQTLSAAYIGAVGRRLLQTAFIFAPNSKFTNAFLLDNAATSEYNAFQLQYQRRLSRGLQALASYTWSHSIDTASAGSAFGNAANALAPSVNSGVNRGPSDFDIRNSFSAGLTYEIRAPKEGGFGRVVLHGWSTENFILARSAPPVNVFEGSIFEINSGFTQIRPDVKTGVPLYLFGSQCIAVLGPPCAGGKGFNPAAFTPPPTDAMGHALRQGNLGRNALRGFGAVQWDFAVHRDFRIRESSKLQFRAEMFNVLNHPNFGSPQGGIGFPNFGQSSQMLGQFLNGGTSGSTNLGGGAFSPLYQIGGPRSVQFGLKFVF